MEMKITPDWQRKKINEEGEECCEAGSMSASPGCSNAEFLSKVNDALKSALAKKDKLAFGTTHAYYEGQADAFAKVANMLDGICDHCI